MTHRTLDDAKLAAVVAAVAACMERRAGDLRLRAVRPVDLPAVPSPWTLAARLHQMERRRQLASRRNG